MERRTADAVLPLRVLSRRLLLAGMAVAAQSIGWPIASSLSGHLYRCHGFRTTSLLGMAVIVLGALALVRPSLPVPAAYSSPCWSAGSRDCMRPPPCREPSAWCHDRSPTRLTQPTLVVGDMHGLSLSSGASNARRRHSPHHLAQPIPVHRFHRLSRAGRGGATPSSSICRKFAPIVAWRREAAA